ncbi:MAG: hypothetical protein K2X54_09485 [Methylobacterium organophilum]|nr:hypothetical protein [Methylobacterium organophilum]
MLPAALLRFLGPYAAVAVAIGALVSWIEGKDVTIAETKAELTTAKADARELAGRASTAEQVVSSNEDKARKLSGQAARDVAAFDRRLADAREQAERTADAREAIARAEGAASVVCPSPKSPMRSALTGDARKAVRPPVPAEIEAAIDTLSPPRLGGPVGDRVPRRVPAPLARLSGKAPDRRGGPVPRVLRARRMR